MNYVYPTKIEGVEGWSTKTNTQKMTNKSYLCSNSTALAYWGVKNPTYKGHPLRNWPDSVTTPSGSYYRPEEIIASGFVVPNAPDEAYVTSIELEYKWEQIAYSSLTSFGKFDNPIITLKKNGTKIANFTGHKPANNGRCTNNGKNVDSANLATLYSHKINLGNHKITIKDLKKNIKLHFHPQKNQASNHCRIVMQFLRFKITYKDIDPTFKITNTLSHKEQKVDKTYTYKVTLKSTNKRVAKNLPVTITLPKNTTVTKASTTTGSGSYKEGTWTIKTFKKDTATLTLTCKTTKETSKQTFKASFSLYNKGNASASMKISKESVPAPSQPDKPEPEPEPTVINFTFTTNGKKPLVYKAVDNKPLTINVSMIRNKVSEENDEKIIINTDGLITTNIWQGIKDFNIQQDKIDTSKWIIDNIKTSNINLYANVVLDTPDEYHMTALHTESNLDDIKRNIDLTVMEQDLQKEFFKLRLEDGSDVRYNSLIFTAGDDLTTPITYDVENVSNPLIDNITIIGETKRIPTQQAKFITFDINIDMPEDKVFENVIAYLDVYNNEGEQCDDIIIGGDKNITVYNGLTNKYCIIKKLYSNQTNKIKLIVQSDIEQECILKIKPLNYGDEKYTNGEWQASHIIFKDIPNIEMKIEGITELTYVDDNDAYFCLRYIIQNKSNVDGTNVKFKIQEPPIFKRDTSPQGHRSPTLTAIDSNTHPSFNENSRILTFPLLEANSSKYILEICYKAQKKGIYDFIIKTLDDKKSTEDDQYANMYQHKLLVNIDSSVDVRTTVTNNHPYLDEIFDFKIYVKNYFKNQNEFIFNIKDIGQYENAHEQNHFIIENVECQDGVFYPSDNQNQLGIWKITNIKAGDIFELILSLRPTDTKIHVIETEFIDTQLNRQKYRNEIDVLEPNKKIDFNVYHAVNHSDEDIDCQNCDKLTIICDDDFINLNDDIYYIFEITNNNKNPINYINLYARLPSSFLNNGIKCYNKNYPPSINSNNLVSFRINSIDGCQTKKFCIKVTPSQQGTFLSNFMLSTHNAHVLHRQLKLTVDSHYNARTTEHEITIYNFEKTNRYFRREMDNQGNLFKFFNKGDISKRTLDIEKHNASKVETYKGSTLKDIIQQIKDNSKYVEPELLRIGNNHLATKSYEMYPNGFINRFGLLNSEVFHYAGQLPTTSNLVDYAMRWDVDTWDTKVWTGNDYQNGVFDLTIDYAKIPTNFNILELDNPIGNLQSLVNRVKPFGTKAICYYSNSIKLTLKMELDLLSTTIDNNFLFDIELDKLGIITWYNRHDNSIYTTYDIHYFESEFDDIKVKTLNNMGKIDVNDDLETNMTYSIDIFKDKMSQQYIHECYNIVQNLLSSNIAITKEKNNLNLPLQKINRNSYINKLYDGDIYEFYFNGDIENEQIAGIYIENDRDIIACLRQRIDPFINHFTLQENDNTISSTNISNPYNFSIQVQCCTLQNNTKYRILHFWISTNDRKYQYLGYYFVTNYNDIVLYVNNSAGLPITYTQTSTKIDIEEEYDLTKDTPITFSIDDSIKKINETHNDIHLQSSALKWDNINNLNASNKYAIVYNDSNVDKECKASSLQTPKIMLRYDNINIDDTDEIQNIYVNLKANANYDFINNTTINIQKDGDYYLPNNNTSHKTYYPNNITNVNQTFISALNIQQPNITICGNCLRTSLGYYDECPYCNSNKVSHSDEKEAITICYECNWVSNGWNNYCPHCLSKHIEKTFADYNKTYCNKCHTLHDNYYSTCPSCFSKDVTYLQNNEKIYQIFDINTQNIEPIIIKSNINKINVCNIKIPLNKHTNELTQLKTLSLILTTTNHNDGKYYYCPDCESGGLGNYDKCPYCNSVSIENNIINNINFDIYATVNNQTSLLQSYNQFTDTNKIFIDILDLAKTNAKEYFTLSIYAENPFYQQNNNELHALNIAEEYQQEILTINNINISIDNIGLESKYKNEHEWENLNSLYGQQHQGVIYQTNEYNNDYINFSNFNIDEKNLKHLYLHINGINKTLSHIHADIKISDSKGHTSSITIYNVDNDLFNIQEDILPYIKDKNVSIQVRFINANINKYIIITDCYLIAEKDNSHIITPSLLEENTIINHYDNNSYLISTENLWHLNDTKPYYLSGRQLHNGLLCYLDFGKLNSDEYIRLYDIQLVIEYKNKYGVFITDSIDISDNPFPKQLLSGDIVKNQGENWGAIKVSEISLNNLEYEVNINTDNEDLLNSLPLFKAISQSFIADTSNIYKIDFKYDGRSGYPSEYIYVALYDDNGNTPDNLIARKKIQTPNVSSIFSFDFYIDKINVGEKYWIIIEDDNADRYNHHNFKYNLNSDVGNLIITEENNFSTKYENMALSFAIESSYNISEYHDLPVTWELDTDIDSDFKLYNALYRFNTTSLSNVFIKDLLIRSGYTETDDDFIDESSIIDVDADNFEEDDNL